MRIPRIAWTLLLALGWISAAFNGDAPVIRQDSETPVVTDVSETASPTSTPEAVSTDTPQPEATTPAPPSEIPPSETPVLESTATETPTPTETALPRSTATSARDLPAQVSGLAFGIPGFVANVGQSAEDVDFIADSAGAQVALLEGGVVIEALLPQESSVEVIAADALGLAPEDPPATPEPYFWSLDDSGGMDVEEAATTSIRVYFSGAEAAVQPLGRSPVKTRVSYYFGEDPSGWLEDVPVFGEIVYAGLYPGVDLVYALDGANLKSTFVIYPGGQVSSIRLAYEGVQRLSVEPDGSLVIEADGGVVLQESAPHAYQESAGDRRAVTVSFVIGETSVGFEVMGDYDPTLPLIIDPTVTYLSYLGEAESDTAIDVTTDEQGNVYVVGRTTGRGNDAMIVKLTPDTSEVVYWVSLAGAGDDRAYGIEVVQGTAYVVGRTNSAEFGSGSTGDDIFFAILDENGSREAVSLVGGSGDDRPFGLAYDPTSLTFYTVGQTSSTDLPRVRPFQVTNRGGVDAFVAGFSVGGGLAYMSYFGGTQDDFAYDVAVDPQGELYFTGSTFSDDLPPGVYGPRTYSGGGDAYVARLHPATSVLAYTRYLGGEAGDHGRAVAVGPEGEAVVGGSTASQPTGARPFPITSGVVQTRRGGGTYDGFVAKLTNPGGAIAYSTFLGGGAEQDTVESIVVDENGGATLTGFTSTDGGSNPFPHTDDAFQSAPGGGLYDAFLTQINRRANAIVYSTYLGGNGDENGAAVAFAQGPSADYLTVYAAGGTSSDDLDVVVPLQSELRGSMDAFLMRLGGLITPPAWTTSYYVTTDSDDELFATGWLVGSQGTGGLVILDYCQPRTVGSSFGVELCGLEVQTIPIAKVESLSARFIEGWWQGYWEGGGVVREPASYLRLVIGLNNCPDLPDTCVRGDAHGHMPPAHAHEWAAMVARLGELVSARDYASKIQVHGGMDMQLLWETKDITLAWLNAYNDYFLRPGPSAPTAARLYDFGSCEDCQYCLNPSFSCRLADDWTLKDAWYKAWGSSLSWPVPEIYNELGTNATQWYTLALYSLDVESKWMDFSGVLTQWQLTGAKPGVNNTPEEGWRQLFDALYQNPRTRLQYIPWLTNIRYFETPVPTPTEPCYEC
jgi:Beta-propeller repeat